MPGKEFYESVSAVETFFWERAEILDGNSFYCQIVYQGKELFAYLVVHRTRVGRGVLRIPINTETTVGKRNLASLGSPPDAVEAYAKLDLTFGQKHKDIDFTSSGGPPYGFGLDISRFYPGEGEDWRQEMAAELPSSALAYGLARYFEENVPGELRIEPVRPEKL